MPAFLMMPLVLALQTAPALHDLSALDAAAVAASGAGRGEAGGPARGVDSRLRLGRCPESVVAVAEAGVIRLECPALGWRLFVPRVSGGEERGAVPATATGQSAALPTIRRGDAVRLRVSGSGFAVSLRAIAMEDGRTGARIRLRRATGPAMALLATVTGPGEAALDN